MGHNYREVVQAIFFFKEILTHRQVLLHPFVEKIHLEWVGFIILFWEMHLCLALPIKV